MEVGHCNESEKNRVSDLTQVTSDLCTEKGIRRMLSDYGVCHRDNGPEGVNVMPREIRSQLRRLPSKKGDVPNNLIYTNIDFYVDHHQRVF